MALGRLEAGATTGGIKASGFLLKRGMFGGGKMVVHFKLPTEQPSCQHLSSDVTSCDEAEFKLNPSRSTTSSTDILK